MVDARSCHGSARNRDVGRGGRNRSARSVVAVDEAGRKLGERTLGTTTADHLALLTWAEQFGAERRGRSRTVGICRDGLSATCSARASAWRASGPRHLDVVLREYVQHFNTHRPHRSLHQRPPEADAPPRSGAGIRVLRRDRLGGLVHEYLQVA